MGEFYNKTEKLQMQSINMRKGFLSLNAACTLKVYTLSSSLLLGICLGCHPWVDGKFVAFAGVVGVHACACMHAHACVCVFRHNLYLSFVTK